MLDEINELRKMLDYTMRRYNELLERVEKLERGNTIQFCTSDVYPGTVYCTTNTSY